MGAGDSALPAVAGNDGPTAGQQLEVMAQRLNGFSIRSRNWSNRQSTRTRMEMAVGDAPVPQIAESPVTTTAESSEGWGIVERTESSGELAKMVGSTAPTPFTPVTKIAGSLESLEALALEARDSRDFKDSIDSRVGLPPAPAWRTGAVYPASQPGSAEQS